MGCSAGAFGTLVNLDDVNAMLPNVEVKGWCDSGYYPFIEVTEGEF